MHGSSRYFLCTSRETKSSFVDEWKRKNHLAEFLSAFGRCKNRKKIFFLVNSHHGRPLWTINSRLQSSYLVPHSLDRKTNKSEKWGKKQQTFRFWNIMLPLQGWVRTDVCAQTVELSIIKHGTMSDDVLSLTYSHSLIWQLTSSWVLSQLIRKKMENLIKP